MSLAADHMLSGTTKRNVPCPRDPVSSQYYGHVRGIIRSQQPDTTLSFSLVGTRLFLAKRGQPGLKPGLHIRLLKRSSADTPGGIVNILFEIALNV